ncbi:MAG TPA: hypothetical protein VG895_04295 [Patescibacteria group bacterium]|nr:hypothetical protein [Patescibacteria group bacterium]
MKTIYPFSPIKNEKDLNKALEYITSELEKLSLEIFQEKLPITTLKIFPHYFDEYDYLYDLISKKGPREPFSSETSLYIKVQEKILNYNINYLGVRIVDPYRLQVGCGDYEIDNFQEFKNKWKDKSPFIRNFKEDMIEIWHPDFDVLGYVIPKL